MNNIFKEIINNRISAYKVAENSEHLAFLDINPIAYGHTLVIPKKIWYDNIFSLNESNYIDIMKFARKIAIGLEKSISCKRIGLFIMGFDIPHVHIHLIPMNKTSDVDFSKKKLSISNKLLNSLSIKIKNNIIKENIII